MSIASKLHVLVASMYAGTQLKLIRGINRKDYASDEQKKSKYRKMLLMTALRDLMSCNEKLVS